MGRLDRYQDFIRESQDSKYLNNLTDEELEDKMKYLRSEMKDIQEEMSLVYLFQRERKDVKDRKLVSTFPESIFDLNKEQLKFILEHHEGIGKFQYDTSKKYFEQLYGVNQCGFNNKTNQHLFTIVDPSYDLYDESNMDICDINRNFFNNTVKAIEFLGENLDKSDGFVKILSRSHFDEKEKKIEYYSKDLITMIAYTTRNFSSVADMLKTLVEEDWQQMMYSDGDRY